MSEYFIQDIPPNEMQLKGDIAENIGGNFAFRVAVDSGDALVTYLGKAAIGSATSVAAWQVRKIDENSGTVFTWADSDDLFDNVWDDRESLMYG